MGFWIYYVLPLFMSILEVIIANQLIKKKRLIARLLYFMASIGYIIALIFATFYIYASIQELLTPGTFSKIGWKYFCSDNFVFIVVSLVLLTINYYVLRHKKRAQGLKIKI